MEHLPLQIHIDDTLYTKNPDSSELGKKILSEGIELIDALGFEAFTFKKLGVRIGSNESSIYRYFENKHVFLVYLLCWYWSWIEYRLVFATNNIDDPRKRLNIAIDLLTKKVIEDTQVSHINEVTLQRIMVAESAKAYHTKSVDQENKKGYFKAYKRVVQRVSDIVSEINPLYKFPHMLISTVVEGSYQQRYFSDHLPALTDTLRDQDCVVMFYKDLVFKAIELDGQD